MNLLIPNAVLRMKARAALKPFMPVVILCALIANLPSLIAQTASILTGSDPLTYLVSQASTDAELVALLGDTARLSAAMEGFLIPERMASLALNLVSVILSPVLVMGLLRCLLMLLRGEEIQVSTVLSRGRYFFKALGLELLTALRILAWMVPGMVTVFAGAAVMVFLEPSIGMLLYFAGLVMMIVMMIRATLHYSMASTFLADQPSLGLNEAIRLSHGMMCNRKMALFSLTVSVYWWTVLLSLAQSLLAGLFGSVIASTLYMAGSLIVGVYLQTCYCAFYEVYREKAA